MDYFKELLELLKIEREEDRNQYRRLTESTSITERRANGLTWYPIAIRGSEMSRGDYLTVEVERTTHQDLSHQFRSGMPAVFFSNHDPKTDRVEGTVSHQSGNRLKITLLVDELPDWSRDGKLGVELLFDDKSYDEMQDALKLANTLSENPQNRLVNILTGQSLLLFIPEIAPLPIPQLNDSQQRAVDRIRAANELAIVHGPPGTGKTTTLVQAIKLY
jgi:ATP-dependent RNA/DNA helicase IGHMBP2